MMKSPDIVALEVRSAGDGLKDSALVEVDLLSGEMTWANQFYLDRMGLTMQQLRSMTVFDVCPPAFHEGLREGLSDKSAGRPFRPSIWPSKPATGDTIAWWYICQSRTVLHRHWAWMELIQETSPDGPGYAFMRVQMGILSAQARSQTRIEEMDVWAHAEIDRLGRDVGTLRDKVLEATYAARAAAASADKAQKAAEDAAAAVGEVRTEIRRFGESQSRHEGEILRLISTDVRHDKRIEAFEKHVQRTTELAVDAIRKAAAASGRGLSRRVTVPVGLIAAVATIVQWLLSR